MVARNVGGDAVGGCGCASVGPCAAEEPEAVRGADSVGYLAEVPLPNTRGAVIVVSGAQCRGEGSFDAQDVTGIIDDQRRFLEDPDIRFAWRA